MPGVRDSAARVPETFALPAARERWSEFVGMEHAVLPLPADYALSDGELVVWREAPPGRSIREGRIPAIHVGALFLQAAAAAAWLEGSGLWLDESDLLDAAWRADADFPRLSLVRTPAALARRGPGPPVTAVLAAFLDCLTGRSRSTRENEASRPLLDMLLAPEASFRRAEFWVATAFRLFPALSSPAAAAVRLLTMGRAGIRGRSPSVRARLEAARAHLSNRQARIFETVGSPLAAGGALGLECVPPTTVAAARALRQCHCRDGSIGRAVWIAVEIGTWDVFSRRAFESAATALEGEVEVVEVTATAPAARGSEEWRREVIVPCGSVVASLRFYEALSERAGESDDDVFALARNLVASESWGPYVADPTGQAPLPRAEARQRRAPTPAGTDSPGGRELRALVVAAGRAVTESELEEVAAPRHLSSALRRLAEEGSVVAEPGRRWIATDLGRERAGLSPSDRRELCRRWASRAADPRRRIEWLLEAGEEGAALSEAESAIAAEADSPERWFEVSARLAARLPERPAWLEALEAEREVAGGRLAEARERLRRVMDREGTADEKRRARLRCAELSALVGQTTDAGREAADWLRSHPDAPAAERARALCLDATVRSRRGDFDAALDRVGEAEIAASSLPLADRLEAGLVRAAVYSAAGRLREEAETYALWRHAVAQSGEDVLAARLFAREALGLADRRQFPEAVARLEEALTACRDDPIESARIRIDLAGTLYHAGQPDRAPALLDAAIRSAAAAGREDLVSIARGNRVELAIDSGDWETAAAEIGRAVEGARDRRDERRLLVALHQRARLGLRRGDLAAARDDNEVAREISSRLADRLESGELWLEWGDLCVYAGDFAQAEGAYGLAAADLPDRCDSDVRARERLAELAWRRSGAVPADAADDLLRSFESDPFSASERAARWAALLGASSVPPKIARLAAETLRSRGAGALADAVFGPLVGVAPAMEDSLRPIRAALAQALAGHSVAPAPAGLTRIAVLDFEGQEVAVVGAEEPPEAPFARRPLESGAAAYELRVWPPPGGELEAALAWMVETLLYRPYLPAPASDFEEGWRRLGVVTGDASMEEPYRRLVRFAARPVTVLVRGESGTGKEAVARAVHALSTRAAGPFVAVNVPAIPAALLESELFGHVKGAFTGAERDRAGLLEAASGGTIFFDEIADLAPPLQSKLLRALQDREIRRVGENRTRRIDVRVVSATSRDLAREVEAGRFRQDLFYRLNVALVELPALRERGADARRLARHFLAGCAREYGRGELRLEPDAVAAIAAHAWPGNVRELQNAMAQAAALVDGDGRVRRDHLPEPVRRPRATATRVASYRARLDAHRRALVTDALERTGGNRTRAARDLGLSRQALAYLIRELRIAPALIEGRTAKGERRRAAGEI